MSSKFLAKKDDKRRKCEKEKGRRLRTQEKKIKRSK
jgi:hypothetical protein